MTSRRSTGVALAALAMVFTLAACGRGDEGGESAAAESLAPAVSEGPAAGELTVWAMGAEGENFDVLADAFTEANPDVTIDVQAIPWDAAHEQIVNAIAGSQTPDVSMIGTTWQGEFASTGALDPTPSNIDPSAFFEGAWNTTVVDGVSYGVPFYVETRMIYYRTDLAEEAGITEAPATWDDLKALAQAYKDNGAEWGISLPPGGGGSWQTWMPFVWQAGGTIVDDANAIAFAGEPATEALAFYDSFFEEGLSPDSVLEPGALETGFVDGSIPMFISGPWHIGILEEQGAEEGTWGLAHMPTQEAGTSFVGGANLSVFADSDNRDAAWKFVEFISEPATQVMWFETINDLPSVQSAWEDPAIADDEHLAQFGDQLNDAKAPPAIPNWEQIAAAWDSQVEKMTVGDQAPDATVEAMQEEAESIGTGL